jgi:GNAT superfamily N-acetyltransferase
LTPKLRVEVRLSAPDELSEPLSLLEESLRYGEPVLPPFAGQLARAVERGNLELLAAWADGGPVGVIVLAYRPSISLGATFASIEDLYVKPDARRRGVGRALLGAVGERCKERGVSYVEVQTDEAVAFYMSLGYKPEEGIQVLSRCYAL